MPIIVPNSHFCLIPKELFKEEKKQLYWNTLYPDIHCDNIAKDDFGDFYLLYANSKNAESIHGITFMYNSLQKNFSQQADAICLSICDNRFLILALKDYQLVHSGYFYFSVQEDILYHIVNLSQHFFEDFYQTPIYYNQISQKNLSFLKEYFEMTQI